MYQLTTSTEQVEAAINAMTAKGVETMKAVGLRQLSYFDEGIVEDSGIWGNCLTQELGHKSSGVINRLRDLGLWTTMPGQEGDDSDWWSLTALGADVANTLAANNIEEAPAEQADEITMKVGRKWTYVYKNGELVAEIRTDAAADVISILS